MCLDKLKLSKYSPSCIHEAIFNNFQHLFTEPLIHAGHSARPFETKTQTKIQLLSCRHSQYSRRLGQGNNYNAQGEMLQQRYEQSMVVTKEEVIDI